MRTGRITRMHPTESRYVLKEHCLSCRCATKNIMTMLPDTSGLRQCCVGTARRWLLFWCENAAARSCERRIRRTNSYFRCVCANQELPECSWLSVVWVTLRRRRILSGEYDIGTNYLHRSDEWSLPSPPPTLSDDNWTTLSSPGRFLSPVAFSVPSTRWRRQQRTAQRARTAQEATTGMQFNSLDASTM